MDGELVLDCLVSLHGNLGLPLVLLYLRFELNVERGGGHAAPLLTILPAQLVILLLLIVKKLVYLLNHLQVVVANRTNPLYHALNITMPAFLLEVFDLLPEVLRDFGCGCGGMVGLWEAVLLEELLLVGLDLLLPLKLVIDDLLQLGLEFDLHDADLGRYDVPQFLLDGHLVLEGLQHGLHLHEVLQVRRRQLLHRDLSLEVDRLVVVNRLVTQLYHISVLRIVVVLVVGGDKCDDLLGSLEFNGRFLEQGDDQALSFGLLCHILDLMLTQHKVAHRSKIYRVVKHDIGEFGAVEGFEADIGLAEFVCLGEVLCDLHGDLGEDDGFHARIQGLLVEEVLGLSEHQIREHAQGLAREVGRHLRGAQIRHHRPQVLKGPCRLLEELRRLLDSLTCQVHVAGDPAARDTIVVQRGYRVEGRIHRHLLLSCE